MAAKPKPRETLGSPEDDKAPLPRVDTFEEWLPIARYRNPHMTDEQIRAGWDAARFIFGD